MAYSQTLNVVTGDTLPVLTFTLRDSNQAASGATLDANDSDTWAPIDITGATVTLRIREIGGTTLVDELVGAVTDGAAGEVAVDFADTTFADAGQYEGELEVIFEGGGVQTVVDLIKFKVRASFD
jgi:hypothetical protein